MLEELLFVIMIATTATTTKKNCRNRNKTYEKQFQADYKNSCLTIVLLLFLLLLEPLIEMQTNIYFANVCGELHAIEYPLKK